MGAEGPCVVLIGDPIADVRVEVSASDLAAEPRLQPGGCLAVEHAEMDRLCQRFGVGQEHPRLAGGSALNTASTLAMASPEAVRFVGMAGRDPAGQQLQQQLAARGVQPWLLHSTSGAPTAQCLCLVTPDGERTMRTCLGAALEMSQDSLPQGWAANCRLLHLEGYALYNLARTQAAIAQARQAGAQVSMDLASFEVATDCFAALQHLLHSGCLDLVFCNEEEAGAVAKAEGLATNGATVQSVQTWLLQHCTTAVVSLGAKGCSARTRRQSVTAAAERVHVEDTIGAGDNFCAGFLIAHLAGASLQACAECGCAAGTAAVQCQGGGLSPAHGKALRAKLAGLLANTSAES